MRRWRWFLLIAVTGAAADLASKHWAFSTGDILHLWPGIFQIRLVSNEGIVWGLFAGYNPLFVALSLLAVPFLAWIYRTIEPPQGLSTSGLALMTAGALGNLYDRLRYHAVRDFLEVLFIQWPVFNLADSFICVGAGLFGLHLLWSGRAQSEPAKGSSCVSKEPTV